MSTIAAVALAGALFFWSSAFTGIRMGLAGFTPGHLALLRFGTASIALALYAAATRLRLPEPRDLPLILLMGFAGIAVYHVALNAGERAVPAGPASFLVATAPVFSTLLAALFLGERVTLRGGIAMAVSFAGVALLSLGTGAGVRFQPAALLVVFAAFSESVFFVLQKKLLEKYGGFEVTAYAFWAGTLFLCFYLPGFRAELGRASASAVLAGVYLGIFPGALAYLAWTYSLARLPVSRMTNLLNLTPVLALGIAWVALRELPTLLALAGGLITVSGVALLGAKGIKQRERRLSGPV